MDYSAANTGLWNSVIQIGLIAIAILGANILRRKIFFIRKTLLPTAVFAGFIIIRFLPRTFGTVRLFLIL